MLTANLNHVKSIEEFYKSIREQQEVALPHVLCY